LEKEFPSRRGVSAYKELYERVTSPEKESTCFFSLLFIYFIRTARYVAERKGSPKEMIWI
jgi:hypothetical protein